MKTCTTCKLEKSLDQFNKIPAGKLGVHSKCKKCIATYDRERRLSNYEEFLQKERDRYNSDPKKHSQKSMKSASKHRKKTRERARRYYAENKDKINELRRLNNTKDPSKKRHTRRRRDASKINATPKWLCKDHLLVIDSIYMDAFNLEKELGVPHHVDHIIPLSSPLVCGLHVPWNLQVLTASDNCKKQCKFDGTYDNQSWRS